ncbi:MAG: siderophore ABC transporter substrate-binding protein [Cellulosilyticaceae bacterium]
MKQIKKVFALMLVGMMGVVGVGCSQTKDETAQGAASSQTQETLRITHEYGEVEVPKNPTSVAVTDFGILDTMQALGVEAVTGVPQDTSSIPQYLEAYMGTAYTNIGGLKEPNFEVLYELAPQVIFISGRQADQYEELSRIAPVIYMTVDNNDYKSSLEKNVTLLGDLFGKEKEAKALMNNFNEQVEEVRTLATEKNATGLIAMVNKGEVSVFGANSRFGLLHNTLGITPADDSIDASTHGQVVTFEYLLKVNPEYFFVVDRQAVVSGDGEAGSTAKEILSNSLVNKMKAAQEGRIIYLDPVAWYISPGGVQAAHTMVQEIKEALN